MMVSITIDNVDMTAYLQNKSVKQYEMIVLQRRIDLHLYISQKVYLEGARHRNRNNM